MSSATREHAPGAFRAFVDASDEGMLVTDEEGTIVYANRAAGEVFGMACSELIGRRGGDMCRPGHLFMMRELLSRAKQSPGDVFAASIDIVRGDGDHMPTDVRIVNHVATPGINGILAYVRKSTAADGALADSFRALFDQALVGMGVADMQGNLLAFNDAMLRPGGYARDDIRRIGNVALLYAREEDRPRVLQLLRAKGHVWREPVPFLAKDGSSYDTLLTLTPVVFLGRPCLYATVEVVGDTEVGPE